MSKGPTAGDRDAKANSKGVWSNKKKQVEFVVVEDGEKQCKVVSRRRIQSAASRLPITGGAWARCIYTTELIYRHIIILALFKSYLVD